MFETDPVAIDLNVDAALLLQDMVGIEAYPMVLALRPNIYNIADRNRVRAIIAAELTEVGIIDDDRVHPTVEHWLHCLDRPDVELVVRILDTGLDGEPRGMLRMSLVRRGERQVLAVRCDDNIVIQPVFQEGRDVESVSAALMAALGSCPPLSFAPLTASSEDFAAMSSDPTERRNALLDLGAEPQTARVLSQALFEVVRQAEVVMIEHHDGVSVQPDVCLSVVDTVSGRLAVTPSRSMDGVIWSTYAPGDDSTLHAGIRALIDLLPGRSWFDTSRIG
ncbi:ESX secretion-associated protein EspG [Nocardia sp. NBC_01009]|uniref:ESX secretion-associated protein EspG n=1 Tax=Nocardia sp. NBC_01009 TaxID=2975996 RepID=UPI003866A594|nr:ESX secretion-associated protein EspG [Nocardia sp. NBC_01009]